jgi:hypothetical protein
MSIQNLLVILLSSFSGYVVGRFGHVYLNVWLRNPKILPHHWIYGVVLIFLGLRYSATSPIAFGFGLTISDLRDLLKFKLIGSDKDGKKNFWDID